MSDAVRRVLHVDMDAFFASVEQRDDPALRGRPVAVGGSPEGRGVVAAASYEARRYGVRSAMSCRVAARRCPELVFVRPRFARYQAVSASLHAIFHDFTHVVEPLSLDEAFLDVTEARGGLPTATAVARAIRARVREELGLTCSAGVGPNKLVAKIASDHRKPDGLTVVPPDRVRAFLDPLPVSRLWGVGPATAARLEGLGLKRIVDLRTAPEAVWASLGPRAALWRRMAEGDDPRPVQPRRARKSRGEERTFADDVGSVEALREALAEQASRVCVALAERGQRAASVTLKVRYEDFETVTRTLSLARPTDAPEVVLAAADQLLARTEAGRRRVRLVGLSLSGFGSGEAAQLALPW